MNLVSALRQSVIREPQSLTREELRELWELRLSQLDLQPGIHPEADFQGFCADYQHPGLVWILRENGRVVGTYLQRTLPMAHAGRKILVLAPDYVFLDEPLRGHMILAFAVIWLTVRPMLSHPLRRAYATGGVYPSAYIPWRRRLERCWSLGDPALTDAQERLVADAGERIWTDRWIGDGTLRFRTVPTSRRPKSASGIALFEAYERLNPRWQEGRALFFVTPLTLGTVYVGIRNALLPRRTARPISPHPDLSAPTRPSSS